MNDQETYARLVVSELLNDVADPHEKPIPIHEALIEVLTKVGLKLEPIEYTGDA